MPRLSHHQFHTPNSIIYVNEQPHWKPVNASFFRSFNAEPYLLRLTRVLKVCLCRSLCWCLLPSRKRLGNSLKGSSRVDWLTANVYWYWSVWPLELSLLSASIDTYHRPAYGLLVISQYEPQTPNIWRHVPYYPPTPYLYEANTPWSSRWRALTFQNWGTVPLHQWISFAASDQAMLSYTRQTALTQASYG